MVGRKNLSTGIKVEVGTEEVAVDIAIVVEYGTPVPEIAQNIQMSVMKAIETITGLKVVEVNINVDVYKRHIKEGDLVIISASPIPGNERYVSDVINMLYRKGANVINDAVDMVHVSGHACEEELKLMISLRCV